MKLVIGRNDLVQKVTIFSAPNCGRKKVADHRECNSERGEKTLLHRAEVEGKNYTTNHDSSSNGNHNTSRKWKCKWNSCKSRRRNEEKTTVSANRANIGRMYLQWPRHCVRFRSCQMTKMMTLCKKASEIANTTNEWSEGESRVQSEWIHMRESRQIVAHIWMLHITWLCWFVIVFRLLLLLLLLVASASNISGK